MKEKRMLHWMVERSLQEMNDLKLQTVRDAIALYPQLGKIYFANLTLGKVQWLP